MIMVLLKFIPPINPKTKMWFEKNFKGSRIIAEFNIFFKQAFLSTGGPQRFMRAQL